MRYSFYPYDRYENGITYADLPFMEFYEFTGGGIAEIAGVANKDAESIVIPAYVEYDGKEYLVSPDICNTWGDCPLYEDLKKCENLKSIETWIDLNIDKLETNCLSLTKVINHRITKKNSTKYITVENDARPDTVGDFVFDSGILIKYVGEDDYVKLPKFYKGAPYKIRDDAFQAPEGGRKRTLDARGCYYDVETSFNGFAGVKTFFGAKFYLHSSSRYYAPENTIYNDDNIFLGDAYNNNTGKFDLSWRVLFTTTGNTQVLQIGKNTPNECRLYDGGDNFIVINRSSTPINYRDKVNFGGIGYYASEIYNGDCYYYEQGCLFSNDTLIKYIDDDKNLCESGVLRLPDLSSPYYVSNSLFDNVSEECKLSLGEVVISKSVVGIEDKAFYGCENLKKVTNHSHLYVEAGSTDNGYVAYYCDKAGVNNTNEFFFENIDGEWVMVKYTGSIDDIKFPNEIYGEKYKIGDGLFANKGILNLTLSEGIKEIGKDAFAGNSGLQIITIPESVRKIDDGAFEGCTGAKLVINNSPLDIVAGADTHGMVAKYALSVVNNYVPPVVNSVVEIASGDVKWPADVYNMMGVMVKRASSLGEVNELPSGVYVVRSEGGAEKVVVRK